MSNLVVLAKGAVPTGMTFDTEVDAYAVLFDSASQTYKAVKLMGEFELGLQVKTTTGDVVLTSADSGLIVKKTPDEATQVTLPASPKLGQKCLIIDGKGDAAAHNITIVPATGTINGAANKVIDTNYGDVWFQYNGTEWNIISEAATYVALAAVVNAEVALQAKETALGATRVVHTPDTDLKTSDGGTVDSTTVSIDVSAGQMLCNKVAKHFAAVNDQAILGAGVWARSYKAGGVAATMVSASNDCYCALVAINDGGTIQMHAVFAPEAPTGTAVGYTPAQIEVVLLAAGITGVGTIIGLIKLARDAGANVVLTHENPATSEGLAGYRAYGCLYTE